MLTSRGPEIAGHELGQVVSGLDMDVCLEVDPLNMDLVPTFSIYRRWSFTKAVQDLGAEP